MGGGKGPKSSRYKKYHEDGTEKLEIVHFIVNSPQLK